MRGDGYNRLTNGQRDELVKLPVWTTEADRRSALACTDRDLAQAQDAIESAKAGRPGPKNLGEIVAVARYEHAGWMPDACLERWRRWKLCAPHGVEQKSVDDLVAWLGDVEHDMRVERDLAIHRAVPEGARPR